jgi:hypothetical protein
VIRVNSQETDTTRGQLYYKLYCRATLMAAWILLKNDWNDANNSREDVILSDLSCLFANYL